MKPPVNYFYVPEIAKICFEKGDTNTENYRVNL